MKVDKEPKNISLSEDQVKDLQERLRQNKLSEEERELLAKVLQGFVWLNKMLEAKKLSMRKLARLFGSKSEKTPPKNPPDDKKPKGPPSDPPKKNGKNSHDKYSGAKRVFHAHDNLSRGDRCPACDRGNLYEVDPGIFIHIKGAPPLTATVHHAQKLRCATCGIIFTANVPKEARKQKYDETADALIALMKYGVGTPFYRLSKLQNSLGVPLPASTQWERVEELANSVYPVWQTMINLGAQGEVAYIDDTTARVLNLKRDLKNNNKERTGLYTTGIVSQVKDRVFNLFFTGNKYAGENLERLLKERSNELGPIIQMSDALSSNRPKDILTILCSCLSHARRGFKDAEADREKECNYVLHLLGKVYLKRQNCQTKRHG
jgi:transposase